MTTAVYDTNVIASGLLSTTSVPGRLMTAWRSGIVRLILSEPILGEVARTLSKQFFRARFTAEQVEQIVAELRREAVIIPLTAPVVGAASHMEDDLILATAVSGEADYLVTGDLDLQALHAYGHARILSPRAFLDQLEILG